MDEGVFMATIEIKRGERSFEVTGACVDIEFLILGMIQNNTYVISDGAGLLVVDPSADVERILQMIGDRTLDAIICTHHHHDHVGALRELKEATGASVYASAIDAPVIENQPAPPFGPTADSCKVDVTLKDNDVVTVGNMRWKVIATPGHTPGGICLFLDSEYGEYIERANVLISGDTLFAGSIGRTDFEGGNDAQMKRSLKRLSQLPDDTLVLPGHNSLTTIGDEQRRVFRYFC